MNEQYDERKRNHTAKPGRERKIPGIVSNPASGKLLTPQQILHNPCQGDDRFVYFGVNVRFFNIEGTDDKMVDTLGLYAVGLPDVQYHFHGLNPDAVVNHAYSVASYIFEHDAPVKSGETIAGLGENGEFASVNRED